MYNVIVLFLIFSSLVVMIFLLSKLNILYSLASFLLLYFSFLCFIDAAANGYPTFFSIYFLSLFSFPAIIITYRQRFVKCSFMYRAPLIQERLSKVKVVLLISIIAGIAANYYLVQFAQDISGHAITGLEYSRVFSDARYIYGEGIPIRVRAMNVFCHAGAMVSSIVFIEKLFVKNSVSIIYMLPGALLVLESIITGTKSITILVLVYNMSAILVILNYHNIRRIPKKLLLSILIIFVALLTIAILVHYVRAQGNLSIIKIIKLILSSYFIIPFLALISWTEKSATLFPHSVGTNIFEGISHYITGNPKVGDFFYINIDGIIYKTNVYTAYRSIIEDFGLILSPILFSLLIVATTFVVRKIQEKNTTYIPILLLVSNFIFFSFADSLYKYLTNILALTLVVVYFLVQNVRK